MTHASPAPPAPPAPRPSARILVVEDHADLAEALEVNLRREGHEVLRAADGRRALAQVHAAPVSLIILDLGLPHLDGLDVLARVREAGHWCPVLVLTARGDTTDKVEGFRRGADDYVTKPFHMGELLLRVQALLRRGRARAVWPVAEAWTGAGPPATPASVIGYTEAELEVRYGLTARQALVARLLADGLSNPQIAEVLGISRFTARSHAERVLLKLGVATRGRVAAALRAAYEAERGGAG